ncbi:MAG: DUF4149 domain-containing protein [Gammaproteobacteria bacterium]|nr:DUF4149 domain-containing protein [Gammaproteobacteria bacterium]MCP5137820.1 DUF4149 domain-containing protein [Gammaproteobacteria bacterium]
MSDWRGGAEQILLTLWVGGLWVIGYVVAPVLFATLEDRMLAGMLAGRMFAAIAYIGLFAGTVLLVAEWFRADGARRARWAVLFVMLLLVAIGEFVLQPKMAALKAAGLPRELAGSDFAMLHGIASVLYLINSLLGLALVVGWQRKAN